MNENYSSIYIVSKKQILKSSLFYEGKFVLFLFYILFPDAESEGKVEHLQKSEIRETWL